MIVPRSVFMVALSLVWAGQETASAWGLEAEVFEERLQAAVETGETSQAARRLAALAAEALQAGRLDWHFRAVAARAAVLVHAGEASLALRELEKAIPLAQQAGQPAGEAELCAAQAEARLFLGEAAAAAGWLERAWRLALAAQPAEELLARRILVRLAEARRLLGQTHLAEQAERWVAALDDPQPAAGVETSLQPMMTTIQVASDEVARTRFYLSNATPQPVSGTLLLETGDLVLRSWTWAGAGEAVMLAFPAATAGGASSVPQGKKLTLYPGEIRVITVEVEPNTPPRVAQREVKMVWQSGAARQTATAQFLFERAREMADTTASQACHLRLSPLLTVPVYMEVYHRGARPTHVQDVLPLTSRPCRVELYELTGGEGGRRLLAVDAEGDGHFDVTSDAVLADRDRSGFPDVTFSSSKPVAALELHLYPLEGEGSESLELSVTLREGTRWREPADVRHLLDVPSTAPHVP